MKKKLFAGAAFVGSMMAACGVEWFPPQTSITFTNTSTAKAFLPVSSAYSNRSSAYSNLSSATFTNLSSARFGNHSTN